MFKKQSKAFTLIELLVVIAIIAILAVLIIIRIGTAVKDSRDSRRLHDMDQITEALEMYKIKNGGYFEEKDAEDTGNGWDYSYLPSSSPTFVEDLVSAGVMSETPKDPINNNSVNTYKYGHKCIGCYGCDPARGNFYVLGVNDMETSGRPHPKSPGCSCNIDFSSGDPMSDICLGGGVYGTNCRNFQREFDWVTCNFVN